MMINKITPNFVPFGVPPLGDFHSEFFKDGVLYAHRLGPTS